MPTPSGRIAVTGAGGFIGGGVCAAALAAGLEVVGIGPGALPPHPRLRHIPCRIGDPAPLVAVLAGAFLLVHAAGRGTPASVTGFSSPSAQDDLRLAAIVLDAAAAAGVGKVVLISSGGTIYGDPGGAEPIGESQPAAPASPYAAVMAMIEQMGFALGRARRLACVAARLSNPYGPGQRGYRNQGLVAVAFDRLGRGEPVELWGDGSTVRDYVYIADAASGLLAAAQLPDGAVCNVSSGVGLAARQVVTDVAAAARVPAHVVYRPERDPGVSRNVLSSALLTARTGWRPQTGWREGLLRTAAWWSRLPASATGAARAG